MIPEGISGIWRVENFVVSDESARFENLRAMFKPGQRTIRPGTYQRLMHGSTCVMSNTPSEMKDHSDFIRRAKNVGGNILINGLGLGMCLTAILESDKVKAVTVIEKSMEVITLIAPSFSHDLRVDIVCADAFEYKPPKGVKYDLVWHDIWTYICADNLPEMTKLHRKYGKKTDWQGSWCKALCKRYAR